MAIFIPSDRSMTIGDHTAAIKMWQKLFLIAKGIGDTDTAKWIRDSVVESGIPIISQKQMEVA